MGERGYEMTGLKLKMGKYKMRFWKSGFEFGDDCGGRVFIWPWVKWKHNRSKRKETHDRFLG